MNAEASECVVDTLNLIFGRGRETEDFWLEILLPECITYFKIAEAKKWHQTSESVEELFDRRKINYNALFYGICSLVGLHVNLLGDE